ncbi:MAG: tRNA (adenosine(37)-N6)-threonylcarbamoyltransferase complex ATPase subunit type 1 TsaE [Eggerthellales bacterium]|nr:tRNA (adenosine(37)-N6)-threonylcarbamoyltransferase complex ATPase subunit type 1 TsaE [Eggerthellales bacterium]
MATMREPMHIASHSQEETHNLAAALGPLLCPDDVILLTGDLGAGKTQFTQGLAVGLDISEVPTSPTFNIMVGYEGRLPLFHFDLYRLDDPLQLEDIGFYETLESGGVCVIEWGDKFPDDMPDEYLEVQISVQSDGLRAWEVRGVGSRGQELLEAWGQELANGVCGSAEAGVAAFPAMPDPESFDTLGTSEER